MSALPKFFITMFIDVANMICGGQSHFVAEFCFSVRVAYSVTEVTWISLEHLPICLYTFLEFPSLVNFFDRPIGNITKRVYWELVISVVTYLTQTWNALLRILLFYDVNSNMHEVLGGCCKYQLYLYLYIVISLTITNPLLHPEQGVY